MSKRTVSVKALQQKAKKRKAIQAQQSPKISIKKTSKNDLQNSTDKELGEEAPKPEKVKSRRQKTMKMPQSNCNLILQDNSLIDYYPNFLTPAESEALYQDLLAFPHWTHGIYKMYGKSIPTPRLLSALGDEDVSNSYKVTSNYPFTDLTRQLKEKLEKSLDCKFRYAQMNYYRNGNDYIGFHCDSEVYEGDIIASISLGVKRRFVLRHKKWKENSTDKVEFELLGGSLIVMKGDMQDYWKHAVPKQPKVTESRINLTFRNR